MQVQKLPYIILPQAPQQKDLAPRQLPVHQFDRLLWEPEGLCEKRNKRLLGAALHR